MENSNTYTYIVLGAGPGGFQLGLEFKRLGLNYLIIDKGMDAGEFFKQHPRHRTLISINRPNTGYTNPDVQLRYDWNSLIGEGVKRFTEYDKKYFPCADSLLKYMHDLQEEHKLNIQFNTDITNIKKGESGDYVLTDGAGKTWKCKQLVIATGWNKENIPDYIAKCPGAQTYGTHDLDKEKYKNKSVCIIGKGNSAFETADYLLDVAGQIQIVSPRPATLSWFTRYVGSLRAVNNNFLDTYLLKAGNNSININVSNVKKAGDRYEVTLAFDLSPRTFCATYDEVISCVGFVYDTSPLDSALVPDLCKKNKFPQMKGNFEDKKNNGLYYAGTLTHYLDLYSAASGFIHGFRYNSVVLGKYLAWKYQQIELPNKVLSTVREFGDHFLKRINYDSGLFLQQNFICDVMVPQADGTLKYYDNLTLPMATQDIFKDCDHYYTVALPIGETRSNQLNSKDRVLLHERGYFSENTHPVLCRWKKMDKVGEWHGVETFDSKWFPQDQHQIEGYLEASLKVPSSALDKITDVRQVTIEHPLEEVFGHFHRNLKYQTLPFIPEVIVTDDFNALDQALQLSGKLDGDANNLQWDLRITKACYQSFTHMMDIMPYGQMEIFDKIRSTLAFRKDGDYKTSVTWTTEYGADLKGGIVKALLDTKESFLGSWPKEEGIKTHMGETRKIRDPPTSPAVEEIRGKIEKNYPHISMGEGFLLRVYNQFYKDAVAMNQKFQEKGFKTFMKGYFGGAYVIILPPTMQEYDGRNDELYEKIVSCF